MGKYLQIRVKAETFRPEDLPEAWPFLCRAVWGENAKHKPKGLLELVQDLSDRWQFGDWNKEAKKELEPGIKEAVRLRDQLDTALGDWKPTEANKLSDALEDALASLEPLAKKYLDDED